MNRIFHILAGKANPNTMNGVNKVVDALANEQVKMNFNVTVVGIANNTEKRHQPIYNYKLFKKTGFFSYPKEALEYLLANSDENSIFHFHSVFIPWFLPLIKALKKNGREHIFLTPHGQYVNAAMKASLKKRLFFSFFDKRILREVEAVHIIGCCTENNHYINDNSKRVTVIPNGYYRTNDYEYEAKKSLVFGYIGRLECKQKGLDNLLFAFSKYIKNGGHGSLWIAGKGPDEDFLKRIVQKENIKDAVHFLGVVYDDEKWAFLKSCSVLITPSNWEGIPTGCLESASLGCPQLITEATNLGPYVRKYHSGLVIGKSEISSITNLLADFEVIFGTEKYFEMRKNTKKMIDEELNWSNITLKIVKELYGI